MSPTLSPNTQAILLLTAPLIAGRGKASPDLLTPGEYKWMAHHLRKLQRQPADLLAPDADELLRGCEPVIDASRLKRLLARGFLLSQAIERWQTRAIWVVSRADAAYPMRLKARLKNDAPPLLYGCGDAAIFDMGGLAVVGSRHVDDALIEFTKGIGRLTAKARRTLVSGGARGIDQAAMHGALEAGGKVVGVLADSLERAALNREHRHCLMDGQLVLTSPYDPSAGFNVGHAMQRNKLIYALADAALVVSSDYEKGGTWAGAIEQLEKLQLVPVYVRTNGETGKGLEALRRKGALAWPNPETPEVLAEVLTVEGSPKTDTSGQSELSLSVQEEFNQTYEISPSLPPGDEYSGSQVSDSSLTPADELFAKVRELLKEMTTPKTDAQVAADLQVSMRQAKEWLQRLVDEGVLEKLSKPIHYRAVAPQISTPSLPPAEELFAKVRELLQKMITPKADPQVATDLRVYKGQAKKWLQRLAKEQMPEKHSKPGHSRTASSQVSLFE
jgi:predicted Rossmann fold nucleotide-binding protein DprA/Smf involved in DNA uptake